jgi:cytochrome b561
MLSTWAQRFGKVRQLIQKSTPKRYGTIAIAFHWVSAVLILTMLTTGIIAASQANEDAKASLIRVHVVLGATLFALTVGRVLWGMLADRGPASFAGQRRWDRIAERTVRVLLYVAVFTAIGSGVATILISGVALPLFAGGTPALPNFETVPGFSIHGLAAGVLLLLSIGHVGAALWHQLIRKERVLARIGVGRPTP